MLYEIKIGAIAWPKQHIYVLLHKQRSVSLGGVI